MSETCSFFNIDLLKATFGPLLATSTALSVYYLTILRDRKKEINKKEEESKSRAKYILNLIEDSIKSTRKQLDSFESHLAAVRADTMQFHTLTLFINSNISRLIIVLSEESSFVIISKLNIDHKSDSSISLFNQLVAKVDFINALIDNVLGMTKEQFNYQINATADIQVATDGILTNTSVTMIELQKTEVNEVEQRFISSMVEIDKKLKIQPNQDIKTYYDFLVIPTMKIINSFMTNSFRKIDNLQEVIKSAEESNRLYNQLKGTAQIYADQIEEICSNLKQSVDELEKISNIIKVSINSIKLHS